MEETSTATTDRETILHTYFNNICTVLHCIHLRFELMYFKSALWEELL